MLNKIILILIAFTVISSASNASDKLLCASEIEAYVKAEFPHEGWGEDQQDIVNVMLVSSEFEAAFDEMEIEAYALYDEYGYLARRIFIGSEVELNDQYEVVGCHGFYTKASYIDPLAE